MKTPFGAALAVVLAVVMAVASCGPGPAALPSPTPLVTATATPTPVPTASPVPTPRPSPSIEPPSLPLICRLGGPLDGVVDPARYVVENPCRSVTGSVAAVSHTSAGELRFQLIVDYGQEGGLLEVGNFASGSPVLDASVQCVSPVDDLTALAACGTSRADIAPPAAGTHVTVTGSLVHLAGGNARALVRIRELTVLPYTAAQPPLAVLEGRRLWTTIRAAWPAIPPAIFTADQIVGQEANASLTDGLAYVTVQLTTLPTTHEMWHEAGHVLQAVVLTRRGRPQDLFGPNDSVGLGFWNARGFPGQWSDHLGGLAWTLTGWEQFAECFAATNLGDAERTETWGVPLDRARMKQFFLSLTT